MTILKIKKLENSQGLALPKYETAGSAGMDLTASIDEDIIIKSGEIKLIKTGIAIALEKGILIADTKFEFGLDADGTLVLMDEVLTPDSSRYWPADSYAPSFKAGVNPPSYDKQFLRDWLETAQVQGKPWSKSPPAPHLPQEVILQTAAKYQEAWDRLKD